MLKGAGEESAGGRHVPLLSDHNVDDLAELVDRPVQINPPPGDLDLGLIHKPAITCHVSAGSCRIDQQGGEALHTPEDRDVIDLDATLSQQFIDISICRAHSAGTSEPRS
jgi:hypothetical protein